MQLVRALINLHPVWWQKAFKGSIATVLKNKGISAVKSKDVVIVNVCDDAG